MEHDQATIIHGSKQFILFLKPHLERKRDRQIKARASESEIPNTGQHEKCIASEAPVFILLQIKYKC